jgi:hypothetical protein
METSDVFLENTIKIALLTGSCRRGSDAQGVKLITHLYECQEWYLVKQRHKFSFSISHWEKLTVYYTVLWFISV